MKALQPFRIAYVSLATRHMLCVASVDQLYVEPLLLKDLENWDPVDPGRFHDDRFDPARAQPVSKSMKVRRKCSKSAYWLRIAIRRDRHHVHRGANVNRRCVGMDGRHLPPGAGSFCLYHQRYPPVLAYEEGLGCGEISIS